MIERTLVVLKPDAVQRELIGKIISRFEDNKLTIMGMKLVKVDPQLAKKHYTDSPSQIGEMGNKTLHATGLEKSQEIFGTTNPIEIGKQLVEWSRLFIVSIPVVALVLEGEEAISKVRRIVGFTDPSQAEKGTLRSDLGKDSIARANAEKRATENLVHASGSVEEAVQEINLWFKGNELFPVKENNPN